ncbi:hypothetical protein [Streptococcus sp. S784/96/1]|nr:hypothetical protein [Streptococcus sp. S784/96/1]
MKKLQALLIVPVTLLLVTCSKSPKDEFLSLMKEQQKQDKASYDYTIKVDDASGELFAQLEPFKGKAIKAIASQDLKKELVGLTVDLSDFDSSFSDFEMIYSRDKAYMNAVPFAQFAQISGGATEELDDKFLDIEEISGEDMPSFIRKLI